MKEIAYYHGETDLFAGEIEVTIPPKGHQSEVGGVRVEVASDPMSSLEIMIGVSLPIRKEYTGYFTKRHREPIQCNVDVELTEQPSTETVARAILSHSGIKA
jgi:hypothetical protein